MRDLSGGASGARCAVRIAHGSAHLYRRRGGAGAFDSIETRRGAFRRHFPPAARYNRMTRASGESGAPSNRIMSTAVQTKPTIPRGRRATPRAARVGRDPVPERGREHRVVRRRRAGGAPAMADRRRGGGRRQRLRRRLGALAAARGRARGARTPARLRQRLPGRLRGRARALHRDGRRRPDVRLQRDPALRGRARRRARSW